MPPFSALSSWWKRSFFLRTILVVETRPSSSYHPCGGNVSFCRTVLRAETSLSAVPSFWRKRLFLPHRPLGGEVPYSRTVLMAETPLLPHSHFVLSCLLVVPLPSSSTLWALGMAHTTCMKGWPRESIYCNHIHWSLLLAITENIQCFRQLLVVFILQGLRTIRIFRKHEAAPCSTSDRTFGRASDVGRP